MKRRKLWTVIIAFCMLFTLLPVEAADITDVLPAGGGAYSMALAYPVKKAAAHGDLPDTSEMETVNGGDTAQSVSLLANGEYADWEAAGEAAVFRR